MVFCGQCGLQLAPGSTACPRCGSVTEPDLSLSADEPHLFDPTIVTSFPFDPTSTLSAQPPQSSPDRQSYSQHSSNAYQAPPGSYPGFTPQSEAGYQPIPGQYGGRSGMPPLSPQMAPRRRRNGRVVVLLTILFVLLLLLGAMIAVATQPDLLERIIGNPTPTPVVTQTVLSPSDHARAAMQAYYRNINARNYRAAYNLWGSNFQSTNSYSSFAAGYANTRHDDLTINSTTPLPNGTVSVNITLKATEDTTSGIVISTYLGTYIIGLENGAWKFISGNFHKVA